MKDQVENIERNLFIRNFVFEKIDFEYSPGTRTASAQQILEAKTAQGKRRIVHSRYYANASSLLAKLGKCESTSHDEEHEEKRDKED